jgi:hypothetical protein
MCSIPRRGAARPGRGSVRVELVDPPGAGDDWVKLAADVSIDAAGLTRRVIWSPTTGRRFKPGLVLRLAERFDRRSATDALAGGDGRPWTVLELWDYGRPSGLPNQPISLSEARHRSPRSFAISGRCDATTRVDNCSETRGRRRPRSASPLPHWAKPITLTDPCRSFRRLGRANGVAWPAADVKQRQPFTRPARRVVIRLALALLDIADRPRFGQGRSGRGAPRPLGSPLAAARPDPCASPENRW